MPKEINYKLLKDCFFNSYKNYIDYITLILENYNMYKILITKEEIDIDLYKISIVIRDTKYDRHRDLLNEDKNNKSYFEYTNNIILPKKIYMELIEDIVSDFIKNHYIIYSSVNTHTLLQTIQNSKLLLNIKLNSEEELNEAIKLNTQINCNKGKTKVLNRK